MIISYYSVRANKTNPQTFSMVFKQLRMPIKNNTKSLPITIISFKTLKLSKTMFHSDPI